jgi:FkbM family methyltransferase
VGITQRRARALIERILELNLWGDNSFFLIDVGCSGGIDERWFAFGDRLRAIGFDPLVAEIDRLRGLNTHRGVAYEAAYVGSQEYDQLFPVALRQDDLAAKSNQPFYRTTAVAAMQQMTTSYVQEVFNAGAPVVLTERRIMLDDYVNAADHGAVDFLKVDTDGHDIEVILGAGKIMAAGGLLGLRVEMQFHGSPHDYANTFSNIDRALRGHGFNLFDLDVYRYSRADLPAPFVYDIPAQTTTGQVAWGEALYFRDIGSRAYENMWSYEITPERVMKLAALYDLFELPDCAAELLRNRTPFLDDSTREGLLDLLVSDEPGAYASLLTRFQQDFSAFYPSRMAKGDTDTAPTATTSPSQTPANINMAAEHAAVVRRFEQKLAALRERNAILRERLVARNDRVKRLSHRLATLKGKG